MAWAACDARPNRVEEQKEHASGLLLLPDLVQFGSYQIDRRTGEVRKNNIRIRLSRQPFEVLRLLLERPGEIVTREEIRQRLWSNNVFVDFERSLNSAVKKLRHVLNDRPDNPRTLKPYQGKATASSEPSSNRKRRRNLQPSKDRPGPLHL